MKILSLIGIAASLMMAPQSKAQTQVDLKSTSFAYGSPYFTVQPKLVANPENGKAGVALTLKRSTVSTDAHPHETISMVINGLTYDPATETIVFSNQGEKIVCAIGQKFLGIHYFKSTENCEIEITKGTRPASDDLRFTNENYLVVNMKVSS